MLTQEPVKTNPELSGLLEWINARGGTVSCFTPGIFQGEVAGMQYRYFVTEGWVSLRTPSSPAGKGVECKSLPQFQAEILRVLDAYII